MFRSDPQFQRTLVANAGPTRTFYVSRPTRSIEHWAFSALVTRSAPHRASVSGWVAQLVEQRTENPRVAGSIPAPASSSKDEGRRKKDENFYSVLSAVIGFTWVARRAGRKQASNAAAASIKLDVINANGSLGLTP
jgi:hypothetical protein